MPHVSIDDIRIHYAQAGSGSEPIVFLHGNYASWRWWSPVLDRLPAGFVGYAPDLRGCGDTGGPCRNVTIRQLASDVEAFADAAGLGAFHVVGHSLGGAVALELAVSRPTRIKTMTLVAPAPAEGLAPMRDGSSELGRALRAIDPDRPASLAMFSALESASRVFGLHQLNLRRALREMIGTPDPSAPPLDVLVRDATRLSSETTVGFLRALHWFDATDRLRRYRRPCLVLVGARDKLVPREASERMAQRLPRGRLVTWPDAGHAPQLQDPAAFTELLVRFQLRRNLRLRWRLGWAKILAAFAAAAGGLRAREHRGTKLLQEPAMHTRPSTSDG